MDRDEALAGDAVRSEMDRLFAVPAISLETSSAVAEIVGRLVLRYTDTGDDRAWVVAFSGGKDSTMVLHLVFEALRRVRPSRRIRPVCVLSSDTQVETPAITEFITEQLEAIGRGAAQLALPVTTRLVRPELHETFWVRLIGYGYAAPTRNFRWCTDRLKIKPANVVLAALVAEHGGVLVLTGSRYAESTQRAESLRRHTAVSVINPHSTVRGAWMWAPIQELSTEQVWEYLALTTAPWGGTHRRLQNLYKAANSGECPLVLDETSQPCGNSRFGCWTCTVVARDRSIEGFIGSGHDTYTGLAAFRDWLIELRDDRDGRFRENTRRNGRPGNGPYTLAVREEILTRLLAVQHDTGYPLISPDEIAMIKQVWLSDSLIDAPTTDADHGIGSGPVDLPIPTVPQRSRAGTAEDVEAGAGEDSAGE